MKDLHMLKKVTFDNQGEEISGYISTPPGYKQHPAVIVIPPIVGVNDYVKDVTVRLSNAGFVALAVDYYSREGQAPDCSTQEKVMEAVGNLPDQRVVSDVLAATQFLKAQDNVKSDGIGVIGFCIGGLFAYLSACETADLKAAVDFYGLIKYTETSENKPVSPIDRAKDLQAPLLGHFGDIDYIIPEEHVSDFKNALFEHQKVFEFFTYSGAPHAFHDDTRPSYRPVAGKLAWERTLTFLNWYLRDH